VTIEEVKELRQKASDDIRDILIKLQEDTGLEIGRITFEDWGNAAISWVWVELIIPYA
jgi:hypothetical protein